MSHLDIDELTLEQIEELAEKKRKKMKADLEKGRIKYEEDKDHLIHQQILVARHINASLMEFKKGASEALSKFYHRMMEYGGVKKGNKGSFQIETSDDNMRIVYSRNVTFGFDERGDIAAEKIKMWVETMVKKKDKDFYNFVISLLDKSKQDGYDPRNIHKLYKFENKFDHQLYQEGIALFKEAYKEMSSTYYIRYFEKDKEGKWQSIQLNWSAIEITP